MFLEAATLDVLLRQALRHVVDEGISVEASRGFNKEVIGVLLRLKNPRARLSRTEARGAAFSPLGEFAWYLAASDDAEFVSYYIPAYRKETEIDGTIRGAYGPRLFSAGWHNQFANVVDLLRRRPSTRRAVIQLFDHRDLAGTYKVVPCTCSLQFLVRAERVNLVASMRSNDAFRGLPHDVFCFTMLQELVARTLGLELGEYFHHIGSLHLHDESAKAVNDLLGEGVQATIGAAMPPMPIGDPWSGVDAFRRAERKIRTGQDYAVSEEDVDPYWQDLIRLLVAFRHYRDRRFDQLSSVKEKMSSPYYNDYIAVLEDRKS